MNDILGLAAEFIDRLANPSYGAEINEAYAARLDELLRRYPSLATNLVDESLSADDVDLLSTASWLWYLGWCHDHGPLPSIEFLDALYEESDDPVIRLFVVEAVATHPSIVEQYQGLDERAPDDLEELPRTWLSDRLLGLVTGSSEPDHRERDQDDRLAEALEFTTSLLQIGNPVALTTLRASLSRDWMGQQRLMNMME
jgi:hypothetical protein